MSLVISSLFLSLVLCGFAWFIFKCVKLFVSYGLITREESVLIKESREIESLNNKQNRAKAQIGWCIKRDKLLRKKQKLLNVIGETD